MTTNHATIGNDAGEIVGQALVGILEQARAVAATDATVLILGESGVGKELIARRIHNESRRCHRPMITVNCASIPRDLFESEFFGHVRGAFTGATRDRVGRMEAADGGTLFLDEVAEIPLELQGKLLRALQHLSFERVGEDSTRRADVRFIAATNRNLVHEISAGRFRLDLYFRLSVFPLEIPPLRTRPDDITTLAQHFLSQLSASSGRAEPRLSSAQVRHLQSHEWPGNVRELKNVLERAFILSGDGPLQLELALPASAPSLAGRALLAADRLAVPVQGFFTALEFEQFERQNLVGALEAAHWKISGEDGAASLLGLKPSTLSSRLKVLNIQKPEPASLYSRLGGHKAIAGSRTICLDVSWPTLSSRDSGRTVAQLESCVRNSCSSLICHPLAVAQPSTSGATSNQPIAISVLRRQIGMLCELICARHSMVSLSLIGSARTL